MDFKLDYDQMVFLDAEDLAEDGILEAYESLLPTLRQYVVPTAKIEEELDSGAPRYAVRSGTKEFVIYAPDLDVQDGQSWGRATYAFFTIVNEQLAIASLEYRLFAINDGNDLGGMFLTPEQARASRNTLPRKKDWPYLPTSEHPWYGRFH